MRNRKTRHAWCGPWSGRGFSLFEILLALAIFSIALLGLIEGIAMQVRAEALAEDVTRATMLAQSAIEEIRLNQDFTTEGDKGEFQYEGKGFDWEYVMEETDIESLYLLTVTISWSDGTGLRDVVLETYLADRAGPDTALAEPTEEKAASEEKP